MKDRTQHIDYEAAVRARGGFHKAANELLTEAYRADGGPESTKAAVAAHACDVAEQAIFDAFNALSNYYGDEESTRVLHMREWEEPKQTSIGMPIVPDPRMPKNRSTIFGDGESGAGSPPAFVTESVERCVDEVERAVAEYPVGSARVGVVHGTSDGGWRVECRIDDQVFAPRFDTLDKAQDYRNSVAEILDRAT